MGLCRRRPEARSYDFKQPSSRSPQAARPDFKTIWAATVDLAILLWRAYEGRRSIRSIAVEVRTSPRPVTERLAKLEAEGVIYSCHAEIDWRILSLEWWRTSASRAVKVLAQAETVSAVDALFEVERADPVTGSAELSVGWA